MYVIKNWEIRFPEFPNKQILILSVVGIQLLHLSVCSFVQVKGKLAPNMFQDNISTHIEKIYLEKWLVAIFCPLSDEIIFENRRIDLALSHHFLFVL